MQEIEYYLMRYLKWPDHEAAMKTFAKYVETGIEPEFEQRGHDCVEVRSKDLEAKWGKPLPRLPARFCFEREDDAELFVELIKGSWNKKANVA